VIILSITDRLNNDLWVRYGCQWCLAEHDGQAYNDANFMQHVLPSKVCDACGLSGLSSPPLSDHFHCSAAAGCGRAGCPAPMVQVQFEDKL